MSHFAIKAAGLSKQYKIASLSRRHDTLRDQLAEGLRGFFRRHGRSRSGPTEFWALKEVSFNIEEGETVGIIGRNGAGKSTLLKILSRIVEPTMGRAEIAGRLGALLEVGTGFHPELTGRENLYLSGAILGMKRAEIARKFDNIVAFAEIDKFIDTPVKYYSSGMYVRLAFAVAAHLDPDILLIDEVLSVGDLAFQSKCIEHAKRLQTSGATVLFVSHNMFSIKSMCRRVVYLSEGQIRFDGEPEDGIAMYEKENRLSTATWALSELRNNNHQQSLRITEIELLDEDGKSRRIFDYGERMRIRIGYEAQTEVINPNFTVSFFRSDNVACCNFNAAMDGCLIPSVLGTGCVELVTPPVKLVAAQYSIHAIVRHAKSLKLYTAQVGESFHVRHHVLNDHYGVFHEAAVWSWGEKGSSVAKTGDREEVDAHD
jgi:lipopolysaccharide transport system ATP-binding protein